MEESFFTFIGQYGYIAVFLLIVLENLVPPIPGAAILPLSGYMVLLTDMELVPTIISATLGSLVGAFVFYALGRLLSQERLEALFDSKVMRTLGFEGGDVAKAVDWFNRKGQITVLICRCVPVVRSLISIPAGTAKMNIVLFTVYSTIGIVIWNTVLVTLGYYAGEAWEVVSNQVEWISDVVLWIIIIVVIVVAIWWIVTRTIPSIKAKRAAKAEGAEGEAAGEGETVEAEAAAAEGEGAEGAAVEGAEVVGTEAPDAEAAEADGAEVAGAEAVEVDAAAVLGAEGAEGEAAADAAAADTAAAEAAAASVAEAAEVELEAAPEDDAEGDVDTEPVDAEADR